MALSNDQKQKVLYHLNIPGLTIVSGTQHFNSVINDRLADITQEIQDIVEPLLECLDESEQALKDSKKCLKVAQVDGVRINTDHLHNLKSEYSRLRRKLSCTLDIPMKGSNAVIGVSA